MKTTVKILGALFLALVAAGESRGAARAKPNIIFILFDDLGYGQPPCYRAGSEFKMPSLDKLAAQGMKFTDAHSASSVCTPTRYGVMTGRYPWRIGQFGVLTHWSPPIIEKERLTVAALLQAQGYQTAGFGKWHLGMTWGNQDNKVGTPVGDTPATRGFDLFCGYTEARSIATIIGNDRVVAQSAPVDVQPMLARKAVAYLEARAQEPQPFFLYLPLSIPHTPIVPSPEFAGKSGAGNYGDWILEGDDVVGQVMAALDRLQLATNTLLLVSSDNGAAGRVYAPLRGCKTSIWEGGHREPFLARWPGKIKPGSVCDDTICLNDLMATCAEIVGVKLPDNAGEDSFSILTDLLGTATGPVREATVHQSMRGDLALRQGPWKLVFLVGGKQELYNLQDDLSETRNVAAEHPDIVARLATRLQQYRDNGRSTAGAPQKPPVLRKGKGKKRASAEPE
jgi:arylsulfatase A-like enzyme